MHVIKYAENLILFKSAKIKKIFIYKKKLFLITLQHFKKCEKVDCISMVDLNVIDGYSL